MTRYWREDASFPTLRDALASRNAEELKALAKLLGKSKPTRKNDCIVAIEESLAGDGLQRMWEDLDDLSRSAVAEVAHGSDERLNLNRFVAKYGAPPRRHHDDYHDRTKSIPWTLLDIVFTRDVMPGDLKERFCAFVPPPVDSEVRTLDTLPASMLPVVRSWETRAGKKPVERQLTVCETEAGALHDLVAVLRLIDAGKVNASSATRRPTLAAVKTVLGVLRDGDFVSPEKAEKAEDFIRAFAWPLIVQSAGLARLAGSKPN